MFPGTSLTEEGIKAVITASKSLIRWHLTIRLNTMFKTVQLPTSVANLHSSLPNMD
jgi:hypothetical protein